MPKEEKTKISGEEKGLGAILNPRDTRDIPLAKVQAPEPHPDKHKTAISKLTQEDQKKNGSCVGQGDGGGAEYLDYKETGKINRTSKRQLYARCKQKDGQPTNEGTWPRIAGDILTEEGITSHDIVPNDNDLPHAEYINVPLTDTILKDARKRRVKGYAFVPPLIEDVCGAIYKNGVVPATLECGDWSDLPVKPTPSRGRHRILLYGYEKIKDKKTGSVTDAKIYFRNSWGKNWGDKGNGYFMFSDYATFLYDIMVYTDIPNEVAEQISETTFQFTRDLDPGIRHPDVLQLTKRLRVEFAPDGKPCYERETFTDVYDPFVVNAVKRYQWGKLGMTSGSPTTNGFGRLGPKTRAALNGSKPGPLPTPPKVGLYPRVAQMRDTLVNVMAAIGQPIVVTDEYRTIAEQNELYAKGRTKPGPIVTNARGGDSLHNWRCAFDVAFKKGNGITYEGNWPVLGAVGEALGLAWGGWPDRMGNPDADAEEGVGFPGLIDRPHFQYTAGYSIADFKAGRVDEKRFGAVSAAIEETVEEESLQEINIEKTMSIWHRIKSAVITAVSFIGTAIVTVAIANPGAVSDVLNTVQGWINSLGLPAAFTFFIGLLVNEIVRDLLNRRKIAKANRNETIDYEGGFTSAPRATASAKKLELY